MHIIALTTCHNRKHLTMRSLSDLYSQKLPSNITLSVVVVDDGSTDGTSEAINKKFPLVTVIQGNGSLFWAGGMRYGWEVAIKHQDYDALLVFNDDIQLKPNAISILLKDYFCVKNTFLKLSIVTGVFTDTKNKNTTYGGFIQKSRLLPLRLELVVPIGKPKKVDTLNMNFALINREVIKKIGFFSNCFEHAMADIDYGLRLKKAEGNVWITSKFIGFCDQNPISTTHKAIGLTRLARINCLLAKKSIPLKAWFVFCCRHGGVFWPFLFLQPYFKAFIFNR